MKLHLTIAEEQDLLPIHEASIKILSETGCVFHSEKARDTLKKHGAKVTGKTVYFPENLVRTAMATVPSTFQWRARNATFSTIIGKGGFRLAPNAGNIYVQDLDNGRRLARLDDVRRIQSIHQMSDVVDFVGNNPCDPSDIDPLKRHLYVTYETLKHTDKPLVSYFASYNEQPEETLQMVALAFGEDDVLKNHHVVGTSVATTSPLSYSADVLRVMTAFAEHNQPVMITTAAMGGISGPLDLMGIALQQNTELLAGTVYVQLVNPGNPVVWTPSSTVAWLKTANYSTGTPEAMLPNILVLQMAKDLYKIPTRSMAGLTDSKTVDCQAGYETMQNLMLAMLGGAQIIYEALGVLDNILTTSYEKIIIDEELYKRNARIHMGMDPSDLALPLKLIQETGGGGEYLTHAHTLSNFRSMWSPTVSNWDNYSEWENSGFEDAAIKANKVWKERLLNAPETFLVPEVDKDLTAFIESHK
ncbi:MAG: trimethylamine methyltransferase family protein [Deltaproteobacteria bacterium]|nr:trimethylamine methyltransferase family protein [Deltaproteobacteria bacterium]